jgi:hypothetical protein
MEEEFINAISKKEKNYSKRKAEYFIKNWTEYLALQGGVVHWKVDDEKVYNILKERLGDFELFEDSIRKYLKKQEEI